MNNKPFSLLGNNIKAHEDVLIREIQLALLSIPVGSAELAELAEIEVLVLADKLWIVADVRAIQAEIGVELEPIGSNVIVVNGQWAIPWGFNVYEEKV